MNNNVKKYIEAVLSTKKSRVLSGCELTIHFKYIFNLHCMIEQNLKAQISYEKIEHAFEKIQRIPATLMHCPVLSC